MSTTGNISLPPAVPSLLSLRVNIFYFFYFVQLKIMVIIENCSQAGKCSVRFEVFTAVTMKNAVFWDIKT
jgi:hypothetical protein